MWRWTWLLPLVLLLAAGTVQAQPAPTGRVTYRRADGHLMRIGAQVDSSAEDVTVALDKLAAGGGDAWLATSHDGAQLLVSTQRWDPECVQGACLAVLSGDLAKGRAVRAAGAIVHPDGFSAIARDGRIVYPARSPAHAADLWRLDPAGADFGAPVRLTARSPFAYNTEPSLSFDETKVVFDCGNQPYAAVGTALCEVGLDGSGFRVVLGPTGVQPELAGARLLDRGSYLQDGSIVFAAERNGTQVWRLGAGEGVPTRVGEVFDNDNRPCTLPNGGIASQWLTDAGGGEAYLLKVMLPEDRTFVTLDVGELDPESMGCGA